VCCSALIGMVRSPALREHSCYNETRRPGETNMKTIQYTAKVKGNRLLELPVEAQELGLMPGEDVQVTFNRENSQTPQIHQPNEAMLAALAEIAELNKNRHVSDDSNSPQLLREARAGAIYGYDPTQ
jgi:hypothetical protein